MPSFSVIIPCYRDEDKLAYLLYQLHQLPKGPEEIIVVDGADSERCREICKQYSAHWLTSEPCRGEQLRAGAALAKAEVLWFLHADSRLDDHSLAALKAACDKQDDNTLYYFNLAFYDGVLTRIHAWGANIRSRLLKAPYGDQGLLVRRSDYEAVGGYPDQPLMEDVALAQRLTGRLCRLDATVSTSAERYVAGGWVRRGARNLWTLARYLTGADPEHLARKYRRR